MSDTFYVQRLIFSLLILANSVFAATSVDPNDPPAPLPDLEGSVVYVSRKLRMSEYDVAPPKDFYIDLGTFQGVKVGDVLKVYRSTAVINGVTGNSNNLLKIYLGEVKILLAGEFTSVGRQTTLADPQNTPVMDYPQFMLGDVAILKRELPTPPPSP